MKRLTAYSISTLALIFTTLPTTVHALPQAEFDKLMESYLSKDENIETIYKSLQRFAQKREAEMRQDAAKREAEQLEEQFKNPVKVDLGKSPVKGNPNAKITIIEFSDFQCPYCKRGAEVMEEIAKMYPNDVKISFKNLPLPFHPQARPAAKAALAAHAQGKFWEMHKELFANQQALNDKLYPELAKKLKLDVEKFKKDMASDAVEKQVDEDMEIASKHGINGTPGYFVNGVLVSGARPAQDFKVVIDRWLAKK